ncbi:MAG: B12-binding domain-containing radical SAM protein, partial [Oscillospiraceae bacterium]|nr:B12-binding domain-containing radical SAM protein [Oscillospiraceae bacterium]
MNDQLRRILPTVQKPSRYVGGEYRQIVKSTEDVDVRVAFCFPDTYEIGMSNLGMRILYGVMNEMPRVWCERCFAPWGDMEEAMRAANLPLWTLESGDPVREFDVIAFSVGYEMSYTNILNMLSLAQVPLHSAARTDLQNIVLAGGTCMYNPEPLADFVDICSLGEGEEVTQDFLKLYAKAKAENWTKEALLMAAAQIPGLYVPALYQPEYRADGTIAAFTVREGAPKTVTKRIVQDLDKAYFPTKTIIPSTEIVHDRSTL